MHPLTTPFVSPLSEMYFFSFACLSVQRLCQRIIWSEGLQMKPWVKWKTFDPYAWVFDVLVWRFVWLFNAAYKEPMRAQLSTQFAVNGNLINLLLEGRWKKGWRATLSFQWTTGATHWQRCSCFKPTCDEQATIKSFIWYHRFYPMCKKVENTWTHY